MKEKECKVCGIRFISQHGNNTLCPECREAILHNKGRGLPRTYDNPSNTNAYEIALRARWNKRYRDTIVAEGYAERQRQETLRSVPKIEPHL